MRLAIKPMSMFDIKSRSSRWGSMNAEIHLNQPRCALNLHWLATPDTHRACPTLPHPAAGVPPSEMEMLQQQTAAARLAGGAA